MSGATRDPGGERGQHVSERRRHSSSEAHSTQTSEIEGDVRRADLMVVTGRLAGRRYAVGARVTIGRDPNATVHVPGDDVSRRHAEIWQSAAGEFIIEDRGSRNGTLVNGMPIEVHVLQFGDKIQIGSRTLFVFTHHQGLEEQLVRWQRIELIAEMTAGLVHDFNNYMAALLGYIQYLQDYCERDAPAETVFDVLDNCLPMMESAAQEGSALARKVLGFARGSKRKHVVLNMAGVAEEAVALVSRTLDKRIVVRRQLDASLRVRGDRTELLQVLINLLLNARDAMKGQGTLTVEGRAAELDPERAAELKLDGPGPWIVLGVRDTGVGMDAETQKRIFEPLYSTKDTGKGTGLGLSMVSRIVESHHGVIDVQSTPGQGACFNLYLPVCEEQDDVAEAGRSTLIIEGRRDQAVLPDGGLVLMMDDDEVMLQRAGRVVSEMGLEVLCCRSVEETLELHARYPAKIQLVVLNLDKADRDSSSIFRALQKARKGCRVLYTSAAKAPELTTELRRYLQTPCDSITFADAISRALEPEDEDTQRSS